MNINHERDRLLTTIGIETLKDRYLLPNESIQEMFARVSKAFADDANHAQRLYNYMSSLWFMPATPILSNGGTNRGLPISCFLQSVEDSIEDIIDNWAESNWLSCKGGGLGIYYGNVRSIGERVGIVGETCGVIPFMKVNDSQSLAISQGNLRRGSAATYLPIWHGDIEEFIELRRISGGDPNRKALNLHHGVIIDDKFMMSIEKGESYDLISPATNATIKTIDARELWIKLLTVRLETGEPYIVFSDRLRETTPSFHQAADLYPIQSNLCSEITLPTNKERTAICCLSSLNLETYDQWKDNTLIIEDIMRFLDNVLDSFIDKSKGKEWFSKAVYSASQERSIGIGTMGFHSLLQSKGIPIDSALAKSININIFKRLKADIDEVNTKLAIEKGACPDAAKYNIQQRFSYTTAIAPNASISVISGSSSPGIEPFVANIYQHKSLSGTFIIRNKYLDKIIKDRCSERKDLTSKEVWSIITSSEGSIQGYEFFTKEEQEVFKTAYEIDQRWLINHASDRQPYIDQAQSLNIFLPSNIDKKSLHDIHFSAWKQKLKTMYYLRSKSIGRAEKVSLSIGNVDECLSCN